MQWNKLKQRQNKKKTKIHNFDLFGGEVKLKQEVPC